MIVGTRLPALHDPLFPTEVSALLPRAAASSGGGVLLVDSVAEERFFSWAELHARARRVAHALVALGIGAGDTVAIVLPTCVGFLDAFWGVLLAGAVPVPLYPPLRLARLDDWLVSTARAARVARVSMVLSDAKLEPLLGRLATEARPRCGVRRVEDLLSSESKIASMLPTRAPTDTALVQYSSGTTREPQPIALTHGNLLAQCAILAECVTDRIGPEMVPTAVSWLPLYHDMGLIGLLLGSTYVCGKLVLMPPDAFLAKPRRWLEEISRHRAQVSASPDFGYALTVRRLAGKDTSDLDLSCWSLALNGAEMVSIRTMQAFADRFAPCGFRRTAFAPVYGLAEASLAVTFPMSQVLPHEQEGADPHAFGALRVEAEALAAGRARLARPTQTQVRWVVPVGGVVPETAVRIVAGARSESPNEEVLSGRSHRELADGEVGRIQVRGPSIMAGRLVDGARPAAVSEDGWLETGDLGFIWRQQLFVTGRSKDLVIVRGKNYAPSAFEDCVRDLDGVRPGGVVALARQTALGEQFLIVAERAAVGRRADGEVCDEIGRTILEHTGVRPDRVLLVEAGSLPRTSSGKLRRAEALRRYEAGTLEKRTAHVRWVVTRALIGSWLDYLRFEGGQVFRRLRRRPLAHVSPEVPVTPRPVFRGRYEQEGTP